MEARRVIQIVVGAIFMAVGVVVFVQHGVEPLEVATAFAGFGLLAVVRA